MSSNHLRFALVVAVLAAGCGGYENAVPFPPEASVQEAAPAVIPDAAAPDAAPDQAADEVAADMAPPPDATTSMSDAQAGGVSAACKACYVEALAAGNGACRVAKPNGCDDIPAEGVGENKSADDRTLCQALDDCMSTTKCWAGDLGPSACFCGTATSLACTTGGANGACKAQIMAATKATTELQASSQFFSPNLPSGFAAQKYACYWSPTCRDLCR